MNRQWKLCSVSGEANRWRLAGLLAACWVLGVTIGRGEDSSFELVGRCDTPGNALTVCVANGMAYVADGPGGLQIIDVTDPAQPRIRGSYPIMGSDSAYGAVAIAVNNNIAYVGQLGLRAGGIHVLDVSDSSSPTQQAFIPSNGSLGVAGVAVWDNRLYVSDSDGSGESKLKIYNISNNILPESLNEYPIGPQSFRIAIHDKYTAIAQETAVRVHVVSSPSQIRMIGYTSTSDATDVDFLGQNVIYSMAKRHYATIAGVQLLEVRQSSLIPRGAYYPRNNVLGVGTSGNFIFGANGADGVFALDVKSLDDLEEAGTFDTPGQANDVTMLGPLALVADGDAGLTILRFKGNLQPTDNAAMTSHTIPATMAPGASVIAMVTVANTSQTDWYPPNYKLSLLNADCKLWTLPYPRINLHDVPRVKPGASYTFEVPLTAPTEPGTYPIELQMVNEFVNFFGEILKVNVRVEPSAQSNLAWQAYK